MRSTSLILLHHKIATIIDERFLDADQLDGVFSGWDDANHVYQYDSSQYQGEAVPSSLADHAVNTSESFSEKTKRMQKSRPPPDLSLQHPNCVYRIMRRHYALVRPACDARRRLGLRLDSEDRRRPFATADDPGNA